MLPSTQTENSHFKERQATVTYPQLNTILKVFFFFVIMAEMYVSTAYELLGRFMHLSTFSNG